MWPSLCPDPPARQRFYHLMLPCLPNGLAAGTGPMSSAVRYTLLGRKGGSSQLVAVVGLWCMLQARAVGTVGEVCSPSCPPEDTSLWPHAMGTSVFYGLTRCLTVPSEGNAASSLEHGHLSRGAWLGRLPERESLELHFKVGREFRPELGYPSQTTLVTQFLMLFTPQGTGVPAGFGLSPGLILYSWLNAGLLGTKLWPLALYDLFSLQWCGEAWRQHQVLRGGRPASLQHRYGELTHQPRVLPDQGVRRGTW